MLLTMLLACGTISNNPFAEDATFVEVFPTEERHTVAFEKEVEPESPPPDPPELLALSTSVSGDCNSFIFALLAAVDLVRSLPPSAREADRREWGPYDWKSDLKVSAWVERSGSGAFDWSFEGQPSGSEKEAFLSGTHYAGMSVQQGDGNFVWQQSRVAGWTSDTMTGTLTVDYDNRSGIDLLVDIDDYSYLGSQPADSRYRYVEKEGEGDWQYRTAASVGWDDDPSTVEVRTRWIVGQGGRSDARVIGSSGREFNWSQCWNMLNVLTYQHDDANVNPDLGAATDCLYLEAAGVDGI